MPPSLAGAPDAWESLFGKCVVRHANHGTRLEAVGRAIAGFAVIVEEKCLVLDVDGTLCDLKADGIAYADLAPIDSMVAQVRNYKQQGFHIILFTARNMRTHSGSVGKLNAETLKTLLTWLDKHDIPYDEIHVGKPWPGRGGFYVDDSAIRPSEFLSKSYDEVLELLEHERKLVQKARMQQS